METSFVHTYDIQMEHRYQPVLEVRRNGAPAGWTTCVFTLYPSVSEGVFVTGMETGCPEVMPPDAWGCGWDAPGKLNVVCWFAIPPGGFELQQFAGIFYELDAAEPRMGVNVAPLAGNIGQRCMSYTRQAQGRGYFIAGRAEYDGQELHWEFKQAIQPFDCPPP